MLLIKFLKFEMIVYALSNGLIKEALNKLRFRLRLASENARCYKIQMQLFVVKRPALFENIQSLFFKKIEVKS